MKTRMILILVAVISFGLGIYANETSCEICHSKLKGRLSQPVTQWKKSIHHQMGINCTNCHGGNASSKKIKSAHSRAKGWIGKPGPIQIVKLCGTCHANESFMKKYDPNARTDQLKNYLTSNHGVNIMKEKDGRAATCASCHGAHDILKAMNPRSHVYPENVVDTCAKCHADKKLMADFDISGNEVAAYKSSVHATALYKKHDLSAPTCNDCHGNHGAAPPGAASVEKVCGTCHVMNQKLFNESPHKEWDEMGLRGCIECHSNHAIMPPTDVMLSADKGVCLNCHDSGEPAFKTMQAMHKTLTGLETKLTDTRDMVDAAAEKGMLMDDARLDLQDAMTAYIKSRTAVHKFSSAYMDKVAKSALVDITKIQKLAKERLHEVTKRRTSFYWFGGLILMILILLGVKIRSMEK